LEPQPTPTPAPPQALPKREIRFRVHAPKNTPPGDTVYLLLMSMRDWDWTEHIALEPVGEGVWVGSAFLEEGALVRYAYDRWDEVSWGLDFKATREASLAARMLENRYLLVTSDLVEVEDTIETWADLKTAAPTGTIAGLIYDAETGAPLMDANVSIGGLHTATDYDGTFRLAGVVAGRQRVTVYRTLGDYRPAATEVEVRRGETASFELGLQPAAPVEVTFEASLPPDTPPWAQVRIAGSVYQLGARLGAFPNQPSGVNLPVMERLDPHRARLTVELHSGTYVQYAYTLGDAWNGVEMDEGGAVLRSFVVGEKPQVRHERVHAWRTEGMVSVDLRVTVPPNTPPGVPVALDGAWMNPVSENQWALRLYGYPGMGLDYRYLLGASSFGRDASPGLDPEGTRSLTFPEADTVIYDRVERWFGRQAVEAAEAGAPVEVMFRVSVPPETPAGALVRLIGDAPGLLGGVPMMALEEDPWIRWTSVQLPAGVPIEYTFDRGDPGTRTARTYSLTPWYSGQVVDDWVISWADVGAAVGPRPGFIAGVYTPDMWSAQFVALSPTTFARIKEHNADWVVISSIWNYARTQPLPVIEVRPMLAGWSSPTLQEIREQAAIAHDQGLRVILAPQFNMEMSEGGIPAVCDTQTDAWWAGWLEEAERVWLWHAIVAQEIGAEALLLPGHCFHVFAPPSFFETRAAAEAFDARVAELIAAVRERYSGELIVSGSVREFDFPGHADLVGVTTYDTGHPQLPPEATVEAWRRAYDALFAQKVDPLYDRWGVPVLFYTLHMPAHPADPDPTGQALQARRLEAVFQALAERPWVAGTLSWGYTMLAAPLEPQDGLRGRLGEAVMAKWYGLLAGQ
jgi:hypothetical protein